HWCQLNVKPLINKEEDKSDGAECTAIGYKWRIGGITPHPDDLKGMRLGSIIIMRSLRSADAIA
uniref:hypothetical protein n=1 Tax=Anabaena sp. CCY 0017 TaxID=3103866 RepID=UPI0039C6DBCC